MMPMQYKGDKILTKVLWFRNRAKFDIDFFDLLQPSRKVSPHRRYRSGLYHSDKCCREIQYESALELRFIERLETNPHVVFYWEQPVKIPYWRGRRKCTYTPDYGIYLDSGHVVLAEIKALPDMLDSRVQQKTEALMAFCSERGFGLLLTDGRHIPKDLMKGKVNRKLERELVAALNNSPIHQCQCQEIMERCNATKNELYKAVIRLGLRFRPFPMKLQHGDSKSIFRQVFFERKEYDELCENQLTTLLYLGGILNKPIP